MQAVHTLFLLYSKLEKPVKFGPADVLKTRGNGNPTLPYFLIIFLETHIMPESFFARHSCKVKTARGKKERKSWLFFIVRKEENYVQ